MIGCLKVFIQQLFFNFWLLNEDHKMALKNYIHGVQKDEEKSQTSASSKTIPCVNFTYGNLEEIFRFRSDVHGNYFTKIK